MIGLEELNRVLSLLSWWLMTIKSHNAVGFFDINKVAEGVALKLLNEIYDYQLENLNYEKSNYPGIDLGDNINKIGFQITSRNDSRKIYDNLEKFVKAPAKIYSNGIRFLILSQGKKPRMKENIYKKIYPDLRPEQHILNADELIKKIHQFYDTDSKKFYRIKEILELEIAGKAMKKENIKLLRSKLFEGSKAYYQKLTGINGRFKHLRISDIILTQPKNQWIDQHVIAEGEEDEQRNVLTALPKLWGKSCKHTVILGEGGMGKTVSLIRIWNEYLEKSYEKIPIPVFIALNEYNQISDASKRENFIVSLIKKNYGDQMVSHEDIWEIMKAPLQEEDGFKPSLILLLDGFNEITHDKRELLIEMRHLIEQAKGVQIVVTSRYDVRGNFNWMEFHLLKLMELEDKQVDLYLQEQGTPAPGSVTEGDKNRIRQLIKNPMMLTLYASTCEVQRDHLLDNNCDFKKQVGTPGELLWNFLEAQVARLPERLGDDSGKQWFYKFLLKFLLPAIGYEMEIAGQFEFKRNELNEIIQKYCIRFSEEDFFLAFPEFELHIDDLDLGECPGTKEKIQRRAKIVKIVYEELLMMVNEGLSFRFLHQNFRDFFAAVHVLNETEISLSKGEMPGVFKERILDYFVRRLLGEIEGEHRSKPYLVKDEGWKIDINMGNRLYKVLNLCKGRFGEEVGYAVWNIVTIWKEVRGELSGADLSNVDLSRVPLNGVWYSRFYKGRYLAAVFDGSRVHEKNLLPQGHSKIVCNAVYSSDRKKILSASDDKTIKEWDAETGECMKSLTGHSDRVNSAVYSSDNKKVLSASYDKTIKEWDVCTGQCVKTLVGHSGIVTSVVYSPDGKKILSASDDKTIKEWDEGTGQCVKTLVSHTHWVRSAVYSPDGKKILSASDDKTIKEWDACTGQCVKTLAGHSGIVTSAVYSPDPVDKKILSASYDKTIKEWDEGTGQCVKTLDGHTATVWNATYSPDGKKILSASYDETIKEWDAGTGQCVKTLTGHSETVWNAVYSRDGKKILSASSDQTIKEWDEGTGQCVKTLAGLSDKLTIAVYSPDGKKILSVSYDETIKEWDAGTGQCLKIMAGHTDWVNSVVYSFDGKKILSASFDQTIKEWDAETGQCTKTLSGHTAWVKSVVYSPDGKKILSTSDDQTIKEWDAATGKCLKTHKKKDKPVIPGYPQNHKNIKLKTEENKIYVQDTSDRGKGRVLINIPGLFIQGCSFKNLEKGSQWSKEGLEILRQYHAIVSVGQ